MKFNEYFDFLKESKSSYDEEYSFETNKSYKSKDGRVQFVFKINDAKEYTEAIKHFGYFVSLNVDNTPGIIDGKVLVNKDATTEKDINEINKKLSNEIISNTNDYLEGITKLFEQYGYKYYDKKDLEEKEEKKESPKEELELSDLEDF